MLWFLLACDPSPTADPAAETAAETAAEAAANALEREARLVAAWPQSPEQVRGELDAEADPLARLALVIAISEAWPGTTLDLCATLAQVDRERCTALNERPHLQLPRPGTKGAPPLGGAGDAGGRGDPGSLVDLLVGSARAPARVPPLPAAAGQPVHPVDAGCDGAADPRGCRQQAASRAEPDLALAICAAEAETRWRDECVFRAAELPLVAATGRWRGARGTAGDALEDPAGLRQRALIDAAARAGRLCLEAGAFRPQCLQHVGGRLGAVAPPTGARGHADWAVLGATVETYAAAVEAAAAGAGAPGLGALAADKAWATTLWMAADRGAVPAGAASEDLPEAALPHLRCALAARLVADGRPPGEDLEAAHQALRQALGREDHEVRAGASTFEVASTWSPQAPALLHLPRVHYLADPVRLRSTTPAVDERICLVEAGLRASPPRRDWLAPLARSADPAAAATAERLSRAPLPGEIPSAGPQAPPDTFPRRPRGQRQ